MDRLQTVPSSSAASREGARTFGWALLVVGGLLGLIDAVNRGWLNSLEALALGLIASGVLLVWANREARYG